MASAAIFSSLRRRRSPSLEAFLAPVDLTDVALLRDLSTVSRELVLNYEWRDLFFQRRNSRFLVRRIEVFDVLLECLRYKGSSVGLNSIVVVCFKEMYLFLYRSKMLLDYCARSSKLWLLLQNEMVSGHFHDLNQDVSTILDVFPLGEVELCEDVRELVELLRRQCRKVRLYVDKEDEVLRSKLYGFLDEFENGRVPVCEELRLFFVERLDIRDAKSCRVEIESLEQQIVNYEGDVEPTVGVLNGFVALIRYARFLLFGFEEDEVELAVAREKKPRRGLISQEIADTFLTIPRDFCCPITLELMRDPVIISTGQTYDRSSITRWLEEGHYTCPKTGQMLFHTHLVPNKALRNLIMQWCTAHGIPYDSPETANMSANSFLASSPTKAALEANKATATLLIIQLVNGSQAAKTVAAREIRLLAKTGNKNRAFIAEAGAIPYLQRLLSSPNPIAQENSVTAMLNLSIYEKNKSRIIEEEGCLGSIIEVLKFGHTTEARENAAATLFSLSAIHDYKKRIADEGAVEALAELLTEGSLRGKKDAVSALFNLSTHSENCGRMIEEGAVTALVGALGIDGVAEDAAAALALIVRKPSGAIAAVKEDMALTGLIGMMRCGTPRGKENAVAVLLEMCRNGGAATIDRVVRAPALGNLLQALFFTGTKRARRKAASLNRVFQRCVNGAFHFDAPPVNFVFAENSSSNTDTSFANDISVPVSISLPVL